EVGPRDAHMEHGPAASGGRPAVSLHLLGSLRLAALGLAVLRVLGHREALALAVILAFAVMGRALAIALAFTIVRPFAVDTLHRLAFGGEGHRGGHQGGERSSDRHTLQRAFLHCEPP